MVTDNTKTPALEQEGSKPLKNAKWEKLTHMIAKEPEVAPYKHYQKIYKCKARPAATAISKLVTKPDIVNRLVYLRRPIQKAAEEEVYMTLDFKRRFAKELVTTPVGKITANHRLAQRVKYTTTTKVDEEGNEITKTTQEIWIGDKLKAIELDSKLAGELTPDKEESGTLPVSAQLFIINLINGQSKPTQTLTLEVGEHESIKTKPAKIREIKK